MKLETDNFRRLFTPELHCLASVFKKYDFEIRMAGGAVRDLLLGKEPEDIDFASPATPEEMKEMFEGEGLRMINNRGEEHGTITVRVNDKENFEITTLRIDVLTHGRHATVEYTKDWQTDASRRDLTVNSMFLGLDGTLYDYFGGLEDLRAHRVMFVGDPSARIEEDYLRILRYFRFFGRLAKDSASHNVEVLRAIASHAEGLKQISGERVWMELRKIVSGNHASEILCVMVELNLHHALGLHSRPNLDEFEKVVMRSRGMAEPPQPITLLSALLDTDVDALAMDARLRVSNSERAISVFVVENRQAFAESVDRQRLCYDLLLYDYHREAWSKVLERLAELAKYCGDTHTLAFLRHWKPPRFPVSGDTLMAAGVPQGRMVGKAADFLRRKWKESSYMADRAELLTHLEAEMVEWGRCPVTEGDLEVLGVRSGRQRQVLDLVRCRWMDGGYRSTKDELILAIPQDSFRKKK